MSLPSNVLNIPLAHNAIALSSLQAILSPQNNRPSKRCQPKANHPSRMLLLSLAQHPNAGCLPSSLPLAKAPKPINLRSIPPRLASHAPHALLKAILKAPKPSARNLLPRQLNRSQKLLLQRQSQILPLNPPAPSKPGTLSASPFIF